MADHGYVERESGEAVREELYADRILSFIYSHAREHAPSLFRMLIAPYTTDLIGYLYFDHPLSSRVLGRRLIRSHSIDLSECTLPPEHFTTARRIFERQIRYWECRPMSEDCRDVVSPSDSRVLIGSTADGPGLLLKDKFFDVEELLGSERWAETFRQAEFAILRLTPDKYHYNHTPVSGRVADIYEVTGQFNACTPGALVELSGTASKNRRTVTLFDTDVERGSRVGLVAMIEVAALAIGQIHQCYSDRGYENPRPLTTGTHVLKGLPKSLFRPGSSTVVLLFQPGRVRFDDDLLRFQRRSEVPSRFSRAFGKPTVETDIRVRSRIATRISESDDSKFLRPAPQVSEGGQRWSQERKTKIPQSGTASGPTGH